ncbi:MAG TPA: hypothetical protein VK837_13580 [Longimicrobiales bacterium]|nr:hypothetical protein [Longimicrobiales bacterium]
MRATPEGLSTKVTALLAAAALAVGGSSCGDRDRPTGIDEGALRAPRLQVSILSPPDDNAPHAIGSTVPVRVHAAEASGRLVGVGFEARVNGSGMALVDSMQIGFAPTVDTAVTFNFVIPDTLTARIQINLYGVALAPGGARLRSDDHAISTID